MTPFSDRLLFGLGTIHRLATRRSRQELLAQAIACGFRRFDVAPAYGNGLNELELGRALRGRAGLFEVSTKFGIPSDLYGERHPSLFPLLRAYKKYVGRRYGAEYGLRDFARSAMIASVEGSLRRLQRETVDRLLIHEPLSPLPVHVLEELVEGAAQLKRQGKIRQFGIAAPASLIDWVGSHRGIEVLQMPLRDFESMGTHDHKPYTCYGVYRYYRSASRPSATTFKEYVVDSLVRHPPLELILGCSSSTTLESFAAIINRKRG